MLFILPSLLLPFLVILHCTSLPHHPLPNISLLDHFLPYSLLPYNHESLTCQHFSKISLYITFLSFLTISHTFLHLAFPSPSLPGESFSIREGVKLPTQALCSRCGHVSSQLVCKACVLLEGLNKGKPRLGLGKSSKVDEHLAAEEATAASLGTSHQPQDTTERTLDSASDSHSTHDSVLKGLHSLTFWDVIEVYLHKICLIYIIWGTLDSVSESHSTRDSVLKGLHSLTFWDLCYFKV